MDRKEKNNNYLKNKTMLNTNVDFVVADYAERKLTIELSYNSIVHSFWATIDETDEFYLYEQDSGEYNSFWLDYDQDNSWVFTRLFEVKE